MARTYWIFVLVLGVAACDEIPPLPAPRCFAAPGEATPAAPVVCARLAALGCGLDDCAGSYADYARRVSVAEFNALTSCYVHAANCDQVDQCERACGPDGGAVILAPAMDGGIAASDATIPLDR